MGFKAQPIETVYNGYRFRSRNEARWAVFFDTVALPYEYETEGFVLNDHTRYLPDFWLPSLKLWVEIKPDEDNLVSIISNPGILDTSVLDKLRSSKTFNLMRQFRRSQEWPIACILGQPGGHRIFFFGWDLSDSSGGEFECDNATWCVANGQVTLDVHIKSSGREIYADSLYGQCLEHFTYARDYGYNLRPVKDALKKARQARFEHGETPEVG